MTDEIDGVFYPPLPTDLPLGWEARYTGVVVMHEGRRMAQIAVDVPGVPAHPESLRPRPETATIYFLGPEGGPIKIGWAKDVAVRLRDLRLASPYTLWLWASVEGPPSLEREYHARFAAHRLHGEWFERCPEIEAEIARLTTPTPTPERPVNGA